MPIKKNNNDLNMTSGNHCYFLHKSTCEDRLDCMIRFGMLTHDESKKACGNGDLEKLKATYDQSFIDEYMSIACRNGHLDIVIWLYEQGADIRENGDSCVKSACMNGHLDILIWLHEHGADIRTANDICMANACMHGHLEIIKWLHEHGVDMLTNGISFMCNACCAGRFDVVKLLCEFGADLTNNVDEYLSCTSVSEIEKRFATARHKGKLQIIDYIKEKNSK